MKRGPKRPKEAKRAADGDGESGPGRGRETGELANQDLGMTTNETNEIASRAHEPRNDFWAGEGGPRSSLGARFCRDAPVLIPV